MNENVVVKKVKPILMYELKAIEEYLEEMAAKGLFLEDISGFKYYFRKTEPRNVKFNVDVFEKASVFDSRAEEDTLDYAEYCEHAGWNYVCTNGKFQIFYTEKADIIPIETDLNKRLKLIMRASLWQAVANPIYILLCGILILSGPIRSISRNPYELVEMPYTMAGALLLWILLSICSIIDLSDTLRFFLVNTYTIAKENSMSFRNFKSAKRYIRNNIAAKIIIALLSCVLLFNISISMAIIFTVGFIAIYAIFWAVSEIIHRRCAISSRSNNKRIFVVSCILAILIVFAFMGPIASRVILEMVTDNLSKEYKYIDSDGNEVTWFASDDEIPYTLEDAGYHIKSDGYRDKSGDIYHNLLCTDYDYYDSYYEKPEDEPLYSVYYEKIEFKNKKSCQIWEDYCKSNEYATLEELPLEAEKWEANKVYARSYDEDDVDNDILVVYDDYCYILSENMADPAVVRNIKFGN